MERGHGGLYLYFLIIQREQEDFCELEVCLVNIVSSKKARSETLSQKKRRGLDTHIPSTVGGAWIRVEGMKGEK